MHVYILYNFFYVVLNAFFARKTVIIGERACWFQNWIKSKALSLLRNNVVMFLDWVFLVRFLSPTISFSMMLGIFFFFEHSFGRLHVRFGSKGWNREKLEMEEKNGQIIIGNRKTDKFVCLRYFSQQK